MKDFVESHRFTFCRQ